MPQLYRTVVAGDDYWTSHADWLKGQRGGATGSNNFDSTPRYIRNNHDLALSLLVDWSGQGNVMAALILNSFGTAALAPSNPYLHSATQVGNLTFGAAQQIDLVPGVNESFVIPNPVTPSGDGLSLVPYTGAALTVGGTE